MKVKITFMFIVLLNITVKAQSYFPLGNVETDLQSFSRVNGQWTASFPSNNTLGAVYYQGLNFGFDVNNYVSLVNGAGTNELYFGRWSHGWKGWNRIWHSGNLNNTSIDFTAKNIGIGVANPQAGIDIFKSYDTNIPKAIKIMYQGSWGTPQYASDYRFIDIQSTEEGNILGVNAYGMGIGFNPPTYSSPDKLYINGNVGIGTNAPDAKLTVKGKIHTQEVRVDMAGPLVPDYVFEQDYDLTSLLEVEQYIKQNKHLPEVPSAREIEENGLMLAEMNIILLKKVEELTLHLIQQEKINQKQNNEIDMLKKENEAIKLMQQRILNLENQLKN